MSYQEVCNPLSLIQHAETNLIYKPFALYSLPLFHDVGNHSKVEAVYHWQGAFPCHETAFQVTSRPPFNVIKEREADSGLAEITTGPARPLFTRLRYATDDGTLLPFVCRLQLRAAVIFISVISPASPIGMCAQLSLFSTFWRACWRGRTPPGVGAGAQRGFRRSRGGKASRGWR